jgi:biotin carboxylase
MKGKKLLVIGAGWEQVPLVRAAKRLGCEVLATNPTKEGDGLAEADETAVLDPRDLIGALELARARGIQGVVADQCDYSLFAAAYVGESLGLPSVGLEQAQRVTHKLRMRDKIAEAGGVLQPAYRGCISLAEAEAAARSIGYPVIVKPVDNRGNFGVTRVDGPAELKASFLEALAHSHSRIAIVEKFVDGIMTTVEGCFAEGKHRPLAASWKKMLDGKKRVAMDLIYDTRELDKAVPALLTADEAVVKALGLRFGATHAEFIVDKDSRPWLVEIHNRGGGAHIFSKICPTLSGFDTNEHLVRLAFGQEAAGSPKFMGGGSALMSFFQFEPGTVRSWSGEQEVREDARVLDFRMLIKRGEAVKPIIGDAYRHAMIIVKGADERSCRDALKDLRARLSIDYAR